MRRLAIAGLLIFAGISGGFAQAEMSLLEKALCAVTMEDQTLAGDEGSTPTARQHFWMPGENPAEEASAGNSMTSLAAKMVVAPDPMGLTATSTAEWITLSWVNTGTAQADFAGYTVSKAVVGRVLMPATEAPQATTSFQDLTVTAQTHYCYQVFAVDSRGATLQASHIIQASLLPSQPPEIPSNLKAEIMEERVRLTWKKVLKTSHDVRGYLVMRSRPGNTGADCITPIVVSKEEFYDDTGVSGTVYAYQVLTVDSKGQTSAASESVEGKARPRNRNGLILTSTAYRGMGRMDYGFTGDMQFTYYIGTLYGEQDKELSEFPLYLDPISLWLLTGDVKYTFLLDDDFPYFPLAAAVGGKASLMLFAGQQSESSGSFTFSEKTEFDYIWGGYTTLSRSFGNWGIHGGYSLGSLGDPLFYLSKYMRYGETQRTRNLFYMGLDFPIVRRMNAALEIMYPLDSSLISEQHPVLVNLHVDRLFNFDISYLHWDQGWAFLGYFNIRFTVYPGQ